MFKKNKPESNLTKLYFSLNDEKYSLAKIINLCCEYYKEAFEVSLNYGKNVTYKDNMELFNTIEAEDFESIVFYDENGKSIFSIDKMFMYLELGTFVFECALVKKLDAKFTLEKKLIDKFIYLSNLLYGYSRFIEADVSPLTEEKVKKSWFGIGNKISKEDEAWLIKPSYILSGAAKGFYPVNYLKEEAYTKLYELIIGLPKLESQGSHLIVLSDEEQKAVFKSNRSYSKYLHFSR